MLPAWVQILIYLISTFLVGFILIVVDWTKVVRKTHKSFGLALYLVVSIALGYGVGSLFVTMLNLAMS
ncbi:DUF1146 family protein [Mycoplasma marinum]|uniref:DUF1146 domain-containing protein n=1 Tax=Mycoplasma marinum TaxID=1937190 RepID=A0A4R0XR02_9MOLU|nr:DUF1146 family protein [Mycoplasma marinum]TCG12030.1 hypothetical protein C4B24_00255 [Mycoplasma marinum]